MRPIKAICMLLVTVAVMTSCLNSSSNEATLYDDAAIMTFQVSVANRYVHTKSSSGNDSVYKTKMTPTSYKFHIDQINRLIYNTDSLPTGTDAKHVLCSATARNNGTIAVKDISSDTLRYFSSTDSLDFTTPRTFIVHASSGAGRTAYTVSVNVHKQDGEQFAWEKYASQPTIAKMTGLKAVCVDDTKYVFGNVDGITTMIATSDGKNWTIPSSNINTVFEADAWKNVVVQKDRIFMLNGKMLLTCTDGTDWDQIVTDQELAALVGASSSELYALDKNGELLKSLDFGESWYDDIINDDVNMLPSQDITSVYYPMDLAESTDYVLMVGNRNPDTYPEESTAMVWRKIVDDSPYTPEGFWTYMEPADGKLLALPRLSDLSITEYDNSVLAIGGEGIGGSTQTAYKQIYQSRDNGITWKYSPSYPLPADFDASRATIISDSDGFLWLFCAGSGQVWRGILNRLSWEIQE